MNLHIENTRLSDTPLSKLSAWTESAVPLVHGAQVGSWRISTAPPGKHDLEKCTVFEKSWRESAPDVIAALKGAKGMCLVWARGPVESDGLLQVMKYVDKWIDNGTSYYWPGVSSIDGRPGYSDSWLAFEYDEHTYRDMNNDASLDFESVRFSLLVFTDRALTDIITREFEDLGLPWVLDSRALAVVHQRHYEGCYVVGDYSIGAAAVARVAALSKRP